MLLDNLSHVILTTNLIKLLGELPPDTMVICNAVGNLAIFNSNGRDLKGQIGYIELGEEKVYLYSDDEDDDEMAKPSDSR